MVKNLVMIQDSYINTYHPDFRSKTVNLQQTLTYDERAEKESQKRIVERLNSSEQHSRRQRKQEQEIGMRDFTPGLEIEERVKNINSYEVNKYMQKDV